MGVIVAIVVAVGGGVGAAARYVSDELIHRRFVRHWPIGTLSINTTGSFLLGLIAGALWYHGVPGTFTRITGTGICGGFTTFSTASYETIRLFRERQHRSALLVGLGGCGAALLAGAFGVWLVSF